MRSTAERASNLYGWRAKIGIVIPSNNTVIEPEFAAMQPPGVTTHGARVLSYGNSPEGIVKMEQSAMRAVGELSAGAMSVIAYACLATTLVKGRAWNNDIIEKIVAKSNLPATTAATATFEALRALNARRVAVANAYPPRLNVFVHDYIESEGFDAVSIESLGIENSLELWNLQEDVIADLGRRARRSKMDALCFLATDLPTIGTISMLESELEVPVVTTNQALLWQCMKLTGLEPASTGFGRLLAPKDIKRISANAN